MQASGLALQLVAILDSRQNWRCTKPAHQAAAHPARSCALWKSSGSPAMHTPESIPRNKTSKSRATHTFRRVQGIPQRQVLHFGAVGRGQHGRGMV